MKTENNNSMPRQESLLKAVDKLCDIDKDLLNRLAEQSAREFERAAKAVPPQQSGVESLWRHIMKNRITQLSSAAAILIVALIGLHMIMGPVPVTFAQVIEPILKASTIKYDFIVGNEIDGILMTDIVTESHIRRTMGDTTMIIDLDNEKMLTLNDNKMEALYVDFKGPLKEGTQLFMQFIRDTISKLQQNDDFAPEHLGEKEIDGRMAVGFRASGLGESMVIWADAETATPIRIELGIGQQISIIKNFEFNFPLDVSQISMEVPQGYTLKETNLDLSNATEQDFVAGLKVWVEIMLDGQFPEAITSEAYMKDIPLMEQKIGELGLSEQESEKLGISYMKGMMFINLFPVQGNSDLHYAGKGAAYGDRDTPIVWYRPKDSENYRVIYADLSVKEVTPDQLPK